MNNQFEHHATDEESRLLAGAEAPSVSDRLGLKKVAVASLLGLALVAIGVFANYNPLLDVTSAITDLKVYSDYYWVHTGGNWGRTGQLIYLDRHNVNCGNDAIRYFRMSRPSSSNIRYDIACQRTSSNGARVLESYNGATGSFYGPRVHYIDRQPWTGCRDGFALTHFRARNRGGDHIDYEYTCRRYDGYMNACENKRTGSSNIGNQDIYFLDRFGLDCGNKVMTGFHARGAHGTIYYDYRCCQQNSPDPTPQPIAHPTAQPIANPTAQPIANPTAQPIADPTAEPVADPTEFPIAEPTFAPTAEPTVPVPFTCQFTVTDSIASNENDLQDGCVLLSATDATNSKNIPADVVMACGTQDLTLGNLQSLGLVSSDNQKSLSYVYEAGPATKFSYFTGENMDGAKYSFKAGEKSFIHHHVGAQSANDITKSVRIDADYQGGAKCPGQENAEPEAEEPAAQEEV
jgi:hypothetical protein